MYVHNVGMFTDSFLLDIRRAMEKIPSDKNAGFVLQFKFVDPSLDFYCLSKRGTYAKPSREILDRKMDLELWLPNIDAMYVSENHLKIAGDFLYISPSFEDGSKKDIITLNSNEIKYFKIQYDEYLAEYNGECISDEQRKEWEIEEYNT